MPKNKPIPSSGLPAVEGAAPSQKTVAAAGAATSPPKAHKTSSTKVSALTQQLENASLDNTQTQGTASPKRPSSKRKSKSDNVVATSAASQQQDQSGTPSKQKRSPKSNRVNGVKQQFSTPSKSAPVPVNPAVAQSIAVDLASHYAGPTFHSSPAPSSLPVPSFFASKLNNQFSEPSTSQSTPVKDGADKLPLADHDDSPLAMFFKADREEKRRLRNKIIQENGIPGSPTLRPSSAGGLRDHGGAGSPFEWTNGRNHAIRRSDFPNHSTSELPFHLDLESDNMSSVRSQTSLNDRLKASLKRDESTQQSDLEASTQQLKNMLSINSPPITNTLPSDAPPSPSPIQHHRTRSVAQPHLRRESPHMLGATPNRRVVSSSGVPLHHPKQAPPPDPTAESENSDDQTVAMEKKLRKFLKLS